MGESEPGATAADRAAGELASGFWASFVKSGRPADPARWPAYSAAADTLMDISATGAAPLAGRTKTRLDALAAAQAPH